MLFAIGTLIVIREVTGGANITQINYGTRNAWGNAADTDIPAEFVERCDGLSEWSSRSRSLQCCSPLKIKINRCACQAWGKTRPQAHRASVSSKIAQLIIVKDTNKNTTIKSNTVLGYQRKVMKKQGTFPFSIFRTCRSYRQGGSFHRIIINIIVWHLQRREPVNGIATSI